MEKSNDTKTVTPAGPAAGASLALLIKLGSLVVHHEEAASPQGHAVDLAAINSLRADPEVAAWFAEMNAGAFLPVKR